MSVEPDMELEDEIPCPKCDGMGAGTDFEGDQWECTECDGTGFIAP
jgi:DnaJ-class molecular chaperone